MKKHTAFWAILLCLFLNIIPAGAVEVGGIIDTDTRWTADKSPYLVTGNILIDKDVTLVIDPGVTVKFETVPLASGAYYIRVDGTLKAEGAQDQIILFTASDNTRPWGGIVFTDTSKDWDEEDSEGSILKYCTIEYGGALQDGAAVMCISASPLIANNIIRYSATDGIRASGTSHKIINNLIYQNATGIYVSSRDALLENNYLTDNQQGIYLGSCTKQIEIKNNTIISSSSESYGNCLSITLYYNSDAEADAAAEEAVSLATEAQAEAEAAAEAAAEAQAAIFETTDPDAYWDAYQAAEEAKKLAQTAAEKAITATESANAAIDAAKAAAEALAADILIYKNHIQNSGGNAIAVTENSADAKYILTIKENNIEKLENGNLSVYLYNWKREEPQPADMPDNWWGTADTDEIGRRIFDYTNNFYLPKVTYTPVATESIPDAGSDLIYPPADEGGEPSGSGIISKDTLWTAGASPYIVNGNMLIKENVTLEIEPGVTVQFASAPISSVGYYLQVNGTLKAAGTEDQPIRFTAENPDHTWGAIVFTDSSTDWNESTSSGSVLRGCIIEYGGNPQDESREQFGGALVKCFSASPLIEKNTLRYSAGDGIRTDRGFQKIISNTVSNNKIGINLYSCEGALIQNNYLLDNQQAIYAGSGFGEDIEIRNNTLINSGSDIFGACLAVNLFRHETPSQIVIEQNHLESLAGNPILVAEQEANSDTELRLTGNNIENSREELSVYLYNWQTKNPSPVNMANNWWGTADTSEIGHMIYDAKNDFYLPEIVFQPAAAERISAAGSDLVYIPPDNGDDDEDQGPDAPGVIREDTVWTLEKSPYLITGNILVKQGATLKIEPGVTVQFKTAPVESVGYYIRVDGTFIAQGDEDNPILFTAETPGHYWGCIAFTDTSTDWTPSAGSSLSDESAGSSLRLEPADGSGSVISNCIIEYGGGNVQDGENSQFGGAAIRCASASPLIMNNIIRYSTGDGIRTERGVQTIISNRIHDVRLGMILLLAENARAENNYIMNTQQGIYLTSGQEQIDIKNNTIISDSSQVYGNCISVNLYQHIATSEIVIRKNRIRSSSGNAIAVTEQEPGANAVLSLTENNMENAEGNLSVYLYNWQSAAPNPLSMTNNWWGTIDTEEIELMIYDAKNDFYLPTAEYAPVATEEIPDAGSNLPYPPIANAGPDQPGDGGLPIEWDTTVTLDGSATYDPDDLIAYSWKQTGGPSVILRDSDQAKTSFVAPSVESGNSVLTFQLTVTDPKGFYDSDEISVTINETAVKVKRDEGGTCFVGTMKELDAGFWMLVSGCWFLVSGCWFLVFGCRMLVSGCCFLFPGYRHQATRIKYQASSIKYQASSIKHQASSIKHLASSIRHQASGILIILLGALFFFSPPAFAGYFSVGAGGGGAAEDFNLSFEAGAAEVELGGRNYIFGAGLPVIPHGYNSDILEGPCDNAECIRGDDEPEGTELGLFGKVGMESLYPKMYLSLLLGFTRGTEVQTVRSLATGWEYEQSSEKKNYMLFGVGASYFTEMFDLDLSFQLDIDNRRGITAGVGLHW